MLKKFFKKLREMLADKNIGRQVKSISIAYIIAGVLLGTTISPVSDGIIVGLGVMVGGPTIISGIALFIWVTN